MEWLVCGTVTGIVNSGPLAVRFTGYEEDTRTSLRDYTEVSSRELPCFLHKVKRNAAIRTYEL